jgi:F420-dependent oxidoreductase-like protein
MKLRIFVSPQLGASYDEILRAALLTERLGFDAFFRSDHFLRTSEGPGEPGPTDAWVSLAGLARETTSVRLGTLVTSATFRHPGVLAVQVAQVDQMSGGRVEFGFGTGWLEAEHRALGVPFPQRRFDLFEEQLEIVTGLWSTPKGETFSHTGTQYTLVDNPALPKPTQAPMPIIIGGKGATRVPALAARYGTEYNIPHPDLADVPGHLSATSLACERIGRDPGSLKYTIALVAVIGSDERDYERRAVRRGRDPEALRQSAIAGSPADALERIATLEQQGIEAVYLYVPDVRDLEMIELLATELLSRA